MQRGPPRRPSGGTGAPNPGDGGTPLGTPIASGTTFQPASLQQFIIGPGQVQAVQAVSIASPTTQAQSTSNRPQLVDQSSMHAGMMVMPPLSPSRSYQQATLINHTSPTAGSGHMSLFIQPQEGHELQIVRSQPTTVVTQTSPVQVAYPVSSTVSASGSTIHHHGQSPVRGGIPPLANPTTHTSPQNIIATMNVHQQLGLLASQQQTIGQIQAHLSQSPPPQQAVRRLSASSVTGTSHKPLGERVGPLSNPSLLTLQNPRTSPAQSPDRPRKKIKLEEVNPATAEIGTFRKLICDERLKQMKGIKENYNEHLTEIFFLQAGGNIMDYHSWKKRPTVQLLNFLKSSNLDSDDEEEVIQQEKQINNEVKVITTSGGTMPLATPVAISTTLPPAITAMQLQGGIPLVASSGTPVSSSASSVLPVTTVNSTSSCTVTAGTGVTSTSSMSVPAVTTPATTTVTTTMSSQLAKAMAEATPSRTPVTSCHSSGAVALSSTLTPKTPKTPLSPASARLTTRQHSISAVYDSTIGSQEAIVERAKQEAQVMQRIAELRKEGLWSSRRLPKVQEPARNKAHWDYLLEEMQWLAADFAQERKWKKAGARKIARMISRYHQEQQQKELRAEKEEAQKLKRVASSMAKMIREFWSNIEKVVQYKQQSRLEEKRKKALDLHLSFIVDQTEKYSSWLSEGLTKSRAGSITSSITASPAHSSGIEDVEFDPNQSSTDDEETIERAEAEDVCDEEDKKNEIEALQRESEMPLDELLKTLPREVLDKPASINPSDQSGDEGDDEESRKGDEEFQASDSGEDDEATIAEAEKQEKSDHKQEIKELEDEGDMPIEELMKKYAGAYDSDFETQMSVDVTETEEDTEDETEEEDEEEEEEYEESDEEEVVQEVGMEYLINPDTDEEPSPKKKKVPTATLR